jgi:cytoskeletal protein CcmA (bactofilin family)
MNPAFSMLILILLATLLFALPLLPAFNELYRKHDAKALGVNQHHGGDIRHFANGFRHQIEALGQPLQNCVSSRTALMGTLPAGDEYVLLGFDDGAVFAEMQKSAEAACPFVIVAGLDLKLPPALNFVKEIYAKGQFIGGEDSVFRALLCDDNIHIQRGSKVMRWAHASGDFKADQHCDLYGRISCDRTLSLESGCTFQRLNAPAIVIGDTRGQGEPDGLPQSHTARGQRAEQPVRRRLIEGDYQIQSGEVVSENIIARGKLRIASGARIVGSVKSDEELEIEDRVSIEGSLISAATMHIGRNCRIRGPVIAEQHLEMESGSQYGTVEFPTTVSAPVIEVHTGNLVFGTLWARERGRVIPRS